MMMALLLRRGAHFQPTDGPPSVRVRDALGSGGFGKAFKFLDEDRTGFIEQAEFRNMVKYMNLENALRKPVIDALLELIDSDDDRKDGLGTDIQ